MYLQLNTKTGKTVRLFYDDNVAISYLYLADGTTSSSEAAVASTTSAASSLSQALGLSNKASGTLRVSDYRVSDFLSAASPSLSAATTLTVTGYTFDVLQYAWDTLKKFDLGNKVTLLLTDDGKVAAAYGSTNLSADMVGILSKDGKSVTLAGSSIVLTADTMDYEEDDLGGLVTVSASSASTLHCRSPHL